MTWLFLTNSSEGSQVTIRDLRMPPSLGDTTGRVTSLAPPKEPEGGVWGGTHAGGGLLQKGMLGLAGGNREHWHGRTTQAPLAFPPRRHWHSHPSSVLTSPPDIGHSLDQE